MKSPLISGLLLTLLLGAGAVAAEESAPAAGETPPAEETPPADSATPQPEAQAETDEEQEDDSPEARARRLETERRVVEQALGQPLEQRFEEYLNSPYNTYGRSFAAYIYDSARDLRNAGIGLAIASPVLAAGGFGVYFGIEGSSFEGRVSGAAVLWSASAACLGAGSALWLIWGDDVDRLAPLVGRGRGTTRALKPFVAPLADREGRRGLIIGFSF